MFLIVFGWFSACFFLFMCVFMGAYLLFLGVSKWFSIILVGFLGASGRFWKFLSASKSFCLVLQVFLVVLAVFLAVRARKDGRFGVSF